METKRLNILNVGPIFHIEVLLLPSYFQTKDHSDPNYNLNFKHC